MALDEYQAAAVTAQHQRIRVLAGAGSGKTRALVARIEWLVRREGVHPDKILAITFSKKAAREMWRRLSGTASIVTVQTIHALGYRILRSERSHFKVADEWKRRKMLREALVAAGKPYEMSDALVNLTRRKRGKVIPGFEDTYVAYEEIRKANRQWDFDDLLVVAERWLREKHSTRSQWRGFYSHILVDEAQDTDLIQWSLIGQLITEQTHVFVVGDISQSIYGWRGAVPMEMLHGIDERFGEFVQYELPTNYRSLPEVVQLANRTVDGADGALSLVAHRAGVAKIDHEHVTNDAAFVVPALEVRHQDGMRWGDMAVLYRINAQSEPFEYRLMSKKIPFVIFGSISFYLRSEIQDVIAYLRLSTGWHDEAADRVYNRPSRYLGKVFKAELDRQGGWQRVGVDGGSSLGFSEEYMERRLQEFVSFVRVLQQLWENGAKPERLVKKIYDSGYRDWLVGEEPDDADEMRGENLETLLAAAQRYQRVEQLLEHADACASHDRGREGLQRADRVQLLTIHKAKGQEWPLVCLVGCNGGLFPHYRGDPEEERRLFYVAVTRAQDELLITSSGEPSRFVKDYVVGMEERDVGEGTTEGGESGSGEGLSGDSPADDTGHAAAGGS